MKNFTLLLCLFIGYLAFGQEEEKEFTFLNNISADGKLFTVKSHLEENYFLLRYGHGTDSIQSNEYSYAITRTQFINDVIAKLVEGFSIDATKVTDAEKEKIETLLNDVDSQVEANKTEAQRTTEAIDAAGDEFSAVLSLHKKVPYYSTVKDSTYTDKDGKTKKTYSKTPIDSLTVESAYLNFFNNKASTIVITAKEPKSGKTLEFINRQFSIPIRYFNIYGSSVSAQAELNGEYIKIEYNDVFDYEPSSEHFNYSVANREYLLDTKNSTKDVKQEVNIVQRRFFDFFTGILYSDVMGINTENENSLVNAQVRLLIPMNLRNWRKWTFTRQFTTEANVALINELGDNSRVIELDDTENTTFSNFDLLRKNNLYAKINLDVFTYESKGWFLNTSLGYSAAFYKTGFQYTSVNDSGQDETTTAQLFSLGHGPYINFEIRPQNNFGADVRFSLEDISYNDTDMLAGKSVRKELMTDTGQNHFLVKYNTAAVEANFYWLLNPETSKGGVYAKVGTYYHTQSHDIFPQILVGYATNLTSFVNRFSKDNGN